MSTALLVTPDQSHLCLGEFDPPASEFPASGGSLLVNRVPGFVVVIGGELGVGCLRDSARGKDAGASLQKQTEGLLRNTERFDVHIADPYLISETGSGADFGRPLLRRAYALVMGEEVRRFFAYRRVLLHLAQILRLCRERALTVRFGDGAVIQDFMEGLHVYRIG